MQQEKFSLKELISTVINKDENKDSKVYLEENLQVKELGFELNNQEVSDWFFRVFKDLSQTETVSNISIKEQLKKIKKKESLRVKELIAGLVSSTLTLGVIIGFKEKGYSLMSLSMFPYNIIVGLMLLFSIVATIFYIVSIYNIETKLINLQKINDRQEILKKEAKKEHFFALTVLYYNVKFHLKDCNDEKLKLFIIDQMKEEYLWNSISVADLFDSANLQNNKELIQNLVEQYKKQNPVDIVSKSDLKKFLLG